MLIVRDVILHCAYLERVAGIERTSYGDGRIIGAGAAARLGSERGRGLYGAHHEAVVVAVLVRDPLTA